MKRTSPFFIIVFFLVSCASSRPPGGGYATDENILEVPFHSGQWNPERLRACSRDGTLIVIGVANRQMRREREVDIARIDAARRVAMFHGMRGTVESLHRSGADFFDFISDSQIRLEHTVDYLRFVDRLEFDSDSDVFMADGATLVHFRYAARVIPVNFVGIIGADGRPNWLSVRYLPRVEGHAVAVGVSRNQRWFSDTVMLSAQAAAARLIMDRDTRIQFTVVDDTGHVPVAYIRTSSEGILDGFRVLEFWVDPVTGYVFTLGIARVVE